MAHEEMSYEKCHIKDVKERQRSHQWKEGNFQKNKEAVGYCRIPQLSKTEFASHACDPRRT